MSRWYRRTDQIERRHKLMGDRGRVLRCARRREPIAGSVSWIFGALSRRSMAFPHGIAREGATHGEGGMGVHMPNLPMPHQASRRGGSLRPRPPVPARRSRPGGRDATESRTTTCEVADVHVRIAFPRTCTPISHVRFWIGIGSVENRLRIAATCSKIGKLQIDPADGLLPTRFPGRPHAPGAATSGGDARSPRSFLCADRAVHHRKESNDGVTHETKSALLRCPKTVVTLPALGTSRCTWCKYITEGSSMSSLC